jgi:hypothetical protein
VSTGCFWLREKRKERSFPTTYRMEVKIARRIAGRRPDGAVVLVDRALGAFLFSGVDTIGVVLRWSCQRALDAVAGAPREAAAVPDAVHAEAVPSAQPPAVVVVDHPDRGAVSEGVRQTVHFGLDGESYEIDLSDERATELRSVLQRYVDAGSARSQE